MREQRELRAQGKMVENERVEEREGGELGLEKRQLLKRAASGGPSEVG